MANATIQFTQGVIVGSSGQSVLGFTRNDAITLTDAGGPGATSYQWSIVSMPSPLSAAPAITNATSQVASIAVPSGGFVDGVYIVKLIRTEGATTTVDVRFFGIGDEDGLILPSPGQSGNMANVGGTPLLAIKAGWAGRADATTNDQLDAYLRFMKTRVGRYAGQPQRINFTSSSPSTVSFTDGTDKPYRMVLLTGSALYTEELLAALAQGKMVRYLLTINAGSGGFALKNGSGGPTIFSLTAPASGSAVYEVEAVYEQTNWHIANVTPVSSSATGQVPISDGSKTVLGYITDASISPTAAIAGSKIVPNFAAQNVVTTGSITGGSLIATDLTASQYVKTDGSKKLVSASSIPVGDLSAASQTHGDILYFNGTSWVRLAAGSAGQFLQTNGNAADPQWATVLTTPDFGTQTLTAGRILFANGRTPQWASVSSISVALGNVVLNASQYGNPIIEFTGTIAANRIATFPLQNAASATTNGTIWYVRNATVGGYDVEIKGPTGFGVLVPYGGSAVIYTDGVNFYSVGSSGAGGGSSGAASGDLVGSYPGPQVAFLSGTGGVVTANASQFAIGTANVTSFTFVPETTTSTAGAGFKYVFTGQHGKTADASGNGGGVQIVGGNAGSATAIGGGLEVVLGGNAHDATRGGYVRVVQAPGISGVMQAWVDEAGNVTAHVLDSGINIGSGKKVYFGGASIPVTGLGQTISFGSASPSSNEPTGSIYLKSGATSTTEVLWVRQGSTWAALGQPSGSATGDLSGTYPNPTVAKINGATVPAAGSLTTNHVLMVSGASALSYGFLANANIASNAAIAGSKIAPDFSNQLVQTTGNIQGAKFIVGSSGPTIAKGTGAPAMATEPNGSLFLRTDGSDGASALYSYQGGSWYLVGAGAGGPPTGSATGDLSGSYPSPTVAKINGTSVPALPSANFVLVATNNTTASWAQIANAQIATGAAIDGSKITPNFASATLTAGKITLNASGPTIQRGTGVPAIATEPNGSLFMRTDGTDGTTALYSYQAGAWVSVGTGGGATPSGPAGGDLGGSYPNPDVIKIKGITLPALAPTGAGQFLKSTSTSATTYAALAASDIPSATTGVQGAVVLANDLAGTSSSPTVVALTGASSIVTMRANTFQWLASATVNFTQATPGSDVAAKDFTITSQAPWASASTNVSPGNIVLAVPAGVGVTPPHGKVAFSISGSEQAHVTNGEFTLGSSTRLYLGGNTLPALFSGVGAPSGSAPDGSLYLVRGATGSSTTAYVRASGAWSALSAGGASSASSVNYTDTNAPTFGATNVQAVLDALKANMAPGGTRLAASTYAAAYGVAGNQSVGTTTFTGIGMIRFNPSHFWPAIDGGASRRIKFRAYIESTGGLTAEIRLYNLTQAAVVASSTLSSASAIPTLLTSVDIGGNLAVGVEHDYEVQMRLTGSPTAADRATCKLAQLEVTYV